METQFKNSFIPKKPIDGSVSMQSSRPSKHKVVSTIFSLIGVVIFLLAIAGYAGTYVWQAKLKSDIKKQIVDLQTAKKEFDERFVQVASRLNTRIEQGIIIMDSHVSPSSLYSLLEEYTLQTVSFKQFSFKDNGDGTLAVSGSGNARRYESIVLQSDAFGKSGFLRNVIFTDLKPDESSIEFSFKATLDPRLIFYRNSLSDVTNETN